MKSQVTAAERKRARRRFLRELPRTAQLAVLRELVETRSAELQRAYRGVISIGYGIKVRGKGKGRRLLHRTPAVVFTVAKKRAPRSRAGFEVIPDHLLAYWEFPNGRQLLAIPTDVACSSRLAVIKPQTAVVTSLHHDGFPPEKGTLACAVVRSSRPDQLYVLSCRHFLSLTRLIHPTFPTPAEVRLGRDGALVGFPVAARGRLVPWPQPSFDAQLCRVESREALRQVLGGLQLDPNAPFLRFRDEIPSHYWVRAPGRSLRAAFVKFLDLEELSYGVNGLEKTMLPGVLESDVPAGVDPGFSGAAVTTHEHGGSLIGMHFAGAGRRALAIPAWQLFSARLYVGLAVGEVIAPVNA